MMPWYRRLISDPNPWFGEIVLYGAIRTQSTRYANQQLVATVIRVSLP
jgi:hypothetical protein